MTSPRESSKVQRLRTKLETRKLRLQRFESKAHAALGIDNRKYYVNKSEAAFVKLQIRSIEQQLADLVVK